MKCYETKNEDCSKETHDHLNLDFSKTKECVDTSFDSKGDLDTPNRILDDERSYAAKFGSAHWPAIVINNVTFRGDLEPEGIYLALCSGF